MKSNIIATYLDLKGVKYTQSYISKFRSHPYENNLYGIYDFLSDYDLDMSAFRVEHISDISDKCPFITLLNHEFIIVTKANQDNVIYIKNGEPHILKIEQFERVWSHTVLFGHKKPTSKEPNYEKNKSKERKNILFRMIFWMSVVIALVSAIFINASNQDWLTITLIFLSIVGIFVCSALILETTNGETRVVKKICGIIKNGDCKAVSLSKGSTLFGYFRLCEIGTSFFIISLCVFISSPENINYLILFYICASIVSLWSVFYQVRIVKRWCVLCLIYFGIIWMQIIVVVCYNYKTHILFNSDTESTLTLILISAGYIIFTFIVHWIVNAFIKIKDYEIVNKKYNRLRMNRKVFNVLNETMREISPNIKTRISYGKKNSKNVITVFSNPFCKPCARMHNALDEFICRDCRIDYIFGYFDIEKSKVNKMLLSSYEKFGPQISWDILTKWYKSENKNLSFFDEYNLNPESEWVSEEYVNQNNWIELAKLYSTPTVIFNGRLLSLTYDIEDIKYLINRNCDG